MPRGVRQPRRSRSLGVTNGADTPRQQSSGDGETDRLADLAQRWQHDLVEIARRWKPYGGVPEDEIFVRFGMTKPLFEDVLRQALRTNGHRLPARVLSATDSISSSPQR
jgi:hypothetical protein